MTTLLWILFYGILMSIIALSGSIVLLLSGKTLMKLLLPLVAFSAGSLIGGALFHMIPASLNLMPSISSMLWIAFGFLIFFGLELFL